MLTRYINLTKLSTIFIFFIFALSAEAQDLTQYVDPFIGVKGKGSCVIGPQLPYGSINPSPDTPNGHTDGYDFESKIRGFSQLHVSGTGGAGKYGQFLLSPQIGINIFEDGHDSEKSDEVAEVGYYKVKLKAYNILCEFTPTSHAAIYRFTYPQSDSASLLIDLAHNIPGDIAKRNGISRGGYADNGFVKIDTAKRLITGWGYYWGGWSGEPFGVYFAMKLNKQIKNFGIWKDIVKYNGSIFERINKKKERVGAYIKFNTKNSEQVFVKIAVSMKSIENAMNYLKSEIPAWDFETVHSNAKKIWNEELSKIRVERASKEQETIFYSGLYRTMMMPRNRTGDNPKSDDDAPYWDDHYCVWDTWKTDFPLHVLIDENFVRSNIRAFIKRYKQNGRVLDAFIAGNDKVYGWGLGDNRGYSKNQGGDNVDNIIADAFVKGVKGINWDEAYKILKHDAEEERADSYIENDRGWIPYDTYEYGLVGSKTMEFAYNDFCVSQVAKGLGKNEDYQKYLKRSEKWINLWDNSLTSDGFNGFICPRNINNKWIPFDPKEESVKISSRISGRSFYEASSWEYSYFVPHEINTLIKLIGGKEKFVERLQHAFNNNMINYGNEPSFLTPFLFIYAGRPDLTNYWVRKNFENYTLEGYPGDEDSGAMGSWFVFSSMGLFPNSGQNVYLLTAPLFPKITITREAGEKIVIICESSSKKDIYVKSVELNGKPINRAWLTHDEISKGATIKFIMDSKKSDWGKENLPPSLGE